MALSAAIVAELVAAGLSGDALVAACARIEAASPAVSDEQAERRREADRVRKAEKRAAEKAERLRTSADSADICGHMRTEPANAPACPRADLEPKTQEISYLKTPLKGVKKGEVLAPIAKPKSANAECLTELGKVLDPEHAQAVVDHRNRLRKPMTPHAAALLANSFAQAPDPNAAADEMIVRGWLGWKPGWGGRSQGPPGRVRENSLLVGIEEIEGFGSNVQHFPRIAG